MANTGIHLRPFLTRCNNLPFNFMRTASHQHSLCRTRRAKLHSGTVRSTTGGPSGSGSGGASPSDLSNSNIARDQDQASNATKRVFSGIQPTGIPHIGNYLGAIRQWLALQDEPGTEVILSIADLHSITLPQDPGALRRSVRTTAAVLLACGIDPDRTILFQQSTVGQHAELSWILGCKTTLARIGQFPQWKAKAGNDKAKSCVGLYTYPVLQSADILLYKATHVPVGEDQIPHLELSQDLARIFNNAFGDFFPSPKPIMGDFKKILSLRNPEQKMSKSEADPRGRIMLTDSRADIREKFKKARTDFSSEVTYEPSARPGVSNVVAILSAFTGREPTALCQRVDGVLTTAQFKLVVADVVSERLEPIRDRVRRLLDDDAGYLDDVLRAGAARARQIAEPNFETVKSMVGLSLR